MIPHGLLQAAGTVPLAFFLTLLAFALPCPAEAQSSVRWTTNYYPVTGATLPELRESIRRNRPWKQRMEHDALTEWRVNWQFTVVPSDAGCRCSSFNTQTTISITMPRWTPPTNAPASTIQVWTNYFAALLRHEVGHGQMALAASAELRRRAGESDGGLDCESLKSRLNSLGEAVIEEYRRRDKEYDERTRHGATQGATLPGRPRRER